MGAQVAGLRRGMAGVPFAGAVAAGAPTDGYEWFGSPGMVTVFDRVLTGAASSVDVPIPSQRFAAIHLYTKVRITGGLSTDVHIFAKANDDSTAGNYSWQEHGGGGATNYSAEGIGDARGVIVGLMNVAGDNARKFGVNHTTIPFYSATDADKVTLTEMAVLQDSTGLHVKHHMAGFWSPSTAAGIRKLTLAPEGGQFAAGSRFVVRLEPMSTVIAEQRIAAGPSPATAIITFDNVPLSPFLKLRYKVKSTDAAATSTVCGVRIGNDGGGGDYSYQAAFAAAASPAAAEGIGVGTTLMLIGNIPTSHVNVPTKSFGMGWKEFPFATETDMDKASLGVAGFRVGTGSGACSVYQTAGWYHDASLGDDPIGRIDVLIAAGNFAPGTVVQLVKD